MEGTAARAVATMEVMAQRSGANGHESVLAAVRTGKGVMTATTGLRVLLLLPGGTTGLSGTGRGAESGRCGDAVMKEAPVELVAQRETEVRSGPGALPGTGALLEAPSPEQGLRRVRKVRTVTAGIGADGAEARSDSGMAIAAAVAGAMADPEITEATTATAGLGRRTGGLDQRIAGAHRTGPAVGRGTTAVVAAADRGITAGAAADQRRGLGVEAGTGAAVTMAGSVKTGRPAGEAEDGGRERAVSTMTRSGFGVMTPCRRHLMSALVGRMPTGRRSRAGVAERAVKMTVDLREERRRGGGATKHGAQANY